MKDIEAWLMQTDGGQGLSADWQPPPHRAEDEAVPERNATYSDSEMSSDQLPAAGGLKPLKAATDPRDLPESVGSEYVAVLADNCPASCASDTGGVGLDPFSTCDADDSESDRSVTNRDVDLGAAGNQAANMTASPSNGYGVRKDDEQNIGSMVDNEDYVDERQLMEYLRQLEMERSEELLLERTEERLLEQTEQLTREVVQEAVVDNNTSSRQGFSDSRSTGARPKVSLKLNSLPYL